MPIFQLQQDNFDFPPVSLAEPDGLLAIGGDLRAERLLNAYRHGIFPWFSEKPILWWSPDPRFVLFPDELKISKSMRQVLKKTPFIITVNKAFKDVIRHCKTSPRAGQDGTWITSEMERAYTELHQMGFAVSVEAWQDEVLVGGLYGIRMGGCFFGESMFAKVSNASKAAFISFVQSDPQLKIIDCQVHTEHLESLGARFISRDQFLSITRENMDIFQ